MTDAATKGKQPDATSGDAQIRDPSEKSQDRRIDGILNAREGVIEDRRALRSAMLASKGSERITRRRALEAYRVSVENYLMEAEPLFTTNYEKVGNPYWNEEELGTQVIQPPAHLVGDVEPSVSEDISKIVKPASPVTVEFVGLKSLLKAPRPLRATFTARIHDYAGQPEERIVTRAAPVEWGILDNAVREVNNFLAASGMDVDFEGTPYEGEGGPGL